MARLAVVQQKLAQEGRLGPVARLMPTTAATTLRKGPEPVVMDGPFVQTKAQLIGFYIVDCATPEEAVAIDRDLAQANPGPAHDTLLPTSPFPPGSERKRD